MSDITADRGTAQDWASPANRRRVRRRYAADRRLRLYGLAAISLAVLLLAILVISLIRTGYTAFVQTKIEIEVTLDPQGIDANNPREGNYRQLVQRAFLALFPEVTNRQEQRKVQDILSSESVYILRDWVVEHPEAIGTTIKIELPVSDPYDQLYKGVIPPEIEALSVTDRRMFSRLKDRGLVVTGDGPARLKLEAHVDRRQAEAQNYSAILQDALRSYFPRETRANYASVLAPNASDVLRDRIAADPSLVGRTIQIEVPVAPPYATLAEGRRPMVVNPRFGSSEQIERFRSLVARGIVSTPFNWGLFFHSDSRFPEQAGLAGAIVGSFYALLVCFLISFPVGIAAAVYLEEFAPKNRFTDLIEVNINNLAAVPSVVFGLLGLAVFLNFFGLPRSAPLVGGMVLSLMTLPTIIIATRAALKAVPPSIREAALGVGASRHQVITHHVLPLAMPGILTGTIIGLAQALGETAPLLLIGMNAFIPSVENMGILEPATALPTQIYSWADSPERGFVARTSAAILVLLGFLVIMNAVAVYLRQRFERTW